MDHVSWGVPADFVNPKAISQDPAFTTKFAPIDGAAFTAAQAAWVITFDPVITQNGGAAIAHTVQLSEWRYDGPMIDWTFHITMTAAAAAGAGAVLITLPVAAYSADTVIREVTGGGLFFDTSTSTRVEVNFETTAAGGATMNCGTTAMAAILIGIGDIWRVGVRYRWV